MDTPTKDQDDILFCSKESWYQLNSEGNQIWDQDLVDQFWIKVQAEKLNNDDFNFHGIVFPTGSKKGSLQGIIDFAEKRIPELELPVYNKNLGYLNFTNCTFEADFILIENVNFLTKTFFDNTKFKGRVHFEDVEFKEGFYCTHASFNGDGLRFTTCRFNKSLHMDQSEIANCDFTACEFNSDVSFYKTKFLNAWIHQCTFQDIAWFTEISISGFGFYECRFNGQLEIASYQFLESFDENWCVFRDCKFHPESLTIIEKIDPSHMLKFESMSLPSVIKFRFCDMSNVWFDLCDIVQTHFENCTFSYRRGRIILGNEKDASVEDMAKTYRQLKKNFSEAKDWTKAGDAYVSEMVMTRKSILKKFKSSKGIKGIPTRFSLLINLLIRVLYELLSKYHQSLSRPLILLMVLIISVSFHIHYQWNIPIQEGFNISIASAFPFAGSISDFALEGMFSLLIAQRLISIILITFFVMATRARLKQ